MSNGIAVFIIDIQCIMIVATRGQKRKLVKECHSSNCKATFTACKVTCIYCASCRKIKYHDTCKAKKATKKEKAIKDKKYNDLVRYIGKKLKGKFDRVREPNQFFVIFRKAFEASEYNEIIIANMITTAMTDGRFLNSGTVAQPHRRWVENADVQFECESLTMFNNAFVEALGGEAQNVVAQNVVKKGPDIIYCVGTETGSGMQAPHSDMGGGNIAPTDSFMQCGSLLAAIRDGDICLRYHGKGRRARWQDKQVKLNAGDAVFMSSHQVHCGTNNPGLKLFYSFTTGEYDYDPDHQQWHNST